MVTAGVQVVARNTAAGVDTEFAESPAQVIVVTAPTDRAAGSSVNIVQAAAGGVQGAADTDEVTLNGTAELAEPRVLAESQRWVIAHTALRLLAKTAAGHMQPCLHNSRLACGLLGKAYFITRDKYTRFH